MVDGPLGDSRDTATAGLAAALVRGLRALVLVTAAALTIAASPAMPIANAAVPARAADSIADSIAGASPDATAVPPPAGDLPTSDGNATPSAVPAAITSTSDPTSDPAADPTTDPTADSSAIDAPCGMMIVALPITPPPALPGGQYAGHRLTDDQMQSVSDIIAVGKAMGITDRGIRTALAVATLESSLHSWQVSGPYIGLFQQLADPASGLYVKYNRLDAIGASRMFFDQLVTLVPGYQSDPRPDWQIGEAIQQTNVGELFEQWQPLAVELMTKFYDGVPPYEFLPKTTTVPAPCPVAGGPDTGSVFDPGDIVSDAVFYNSTALSLQQVRAFIDAQGANCAGPWCLRNLRVSTVDQAGDQYCDPYQGAANEDAAAVISKVAVACHVNPQVMLVTLQKESGLLTRGDVSQASYQAAWGWHCPDTGPGGSANCDPTYAGFFNQAYGMAKQWARYKVDPGKYTYRAGQTSNVLWNVAQTGCGGAPVHIQNTATASLYNYTPYQPNAASLASYPGTGDKCSAYGNRNFYFLFVNYFGSTGGGGSLSVVVNGVSVVIPASPDVPAALVGKTITAPNASVAKGLAAGLASLGLPYVWGGGTAGGPADQGCARGGGGSNSCQGLAGFDCSGLTGYVLAQAGFTIPDNSSAQRAAGTGVPWPKGLPGDIIGYPGHVAIYLGTIDGQQYLLEAPYPGANVHIRTVYRSSGGSSADGVLHRYWN